MMIATNGGCAERRITSGTRVSRSHGELRANLNPAIRRRVKERLYGHVVEAVGPNKYNVLFDHGKEAMCASRTLRTERATASIPITEAAATNSENTTEENTAEENTANESSSNNEAGIHADTGIHHDALQTDDRDALSEVLAAEEEEFAEEVRTHEGVAAEKEEPAAEGGAPDLENEGDRNGMNAAADQEEPPQTYHQKLSAARQQIKDLLGREVTIS